MKANIKPACILSICFGDIPGQQKICWIWIFPIFSFTNMLELSALEDQKEPFFLSYQMGPDVPRFRVKSEDGLEALRKGLELRTVAGAKEVVVAEECK